MFGPNIILLGGNIQQNRKIGQRHQSHASRIKALFGFFHLIGKDRTTIGHKCVNLTQPRDGIERAAARADQIFDDDDPLIGLYPTFNLLTTAIFLAPERT